MRKLYDRRKITSSFTLKNACKINSKATDCCVNHIVCLGFTAGEKVQLRSCKDEVHCMT